MGEETAWALLLSLQFVVNCNSIQNLPTFTFIINGVQFPLPPSSYILNVSGGPAVSPQGHGGVGGRRGEPGTWVSLPCATSRRISFPTHWFQTPFSGTRL